jgi:hypothetical protein
VAGWPGSTNEQIKWQMANGLGFFKWQIADHLNLPFAI